MLAPMLASLVLHIQQKQLWYQMEEALERERLVTIHVPASELQWVRKNKEILWQGRHFDTKDVRLDASGIYTITGLYDFKEAEVKSALAKAADTGQQETGRSIWQFISIINAATARHGLLPGEPELIHTDLDICAMPVPQLMAVHIEVPTPPPLG